MAAPTRGNTPHPGRDHRGMGHPWERLAWTLTVALVAAGTVGAGVGLYGTAVGNGNLARAGGDAFGFTLLILMIIVPTRVWIARKTRVLAAARDETRQVAAAVDDLHTRVGELAERVSESEQRVRDAQAAQAHRQREITDALEMLGRDLPTSTVRNLRP